MKQDTIHVVVALDFSDEIIEMLQGISPRLKVERHFPKVSDHVWKQVEILFTSQLVPTPDQAPNLKWIQITSAGMEHLTSEPIITETDVMVTSASGIHAVPIAELTLGMMLAWEYKLPLMWRHQQEKLWDAPRDVFKPRYLRGLTMGIVGYGSIGRELARLARHMGMTILAVKRDVMHPADHHSYIEPGTGDHEGDIPERFYPPEALATMARECDYLVLITPMTEQTRHMVDTSIFEAMPDHAVLVNMGRGGVVDEKALVKALANGDIAGALLDVFEEEPLPESSPLWEMENVMISPHVAGNGIDYKGRAARLFAENLKRYLERRDLYNLLDRNLGY